MIVYIYLYIYLYISIYLYIYIYIYISIYLYIYVCVCVCVCARVCVYVYIPGITLPITFLSLVARPRFHTILFLASPEVNFSRLHGRVMPSRLALEDPLRPGGEGPSIIKFAAANHPEVEPIDGCRNLLLVPPHWMTRAPQPLLIKY